MSSSATGRRCCAPIRTSSRRSSTHNSESSTWRVSAFSGGRSPTASASASDGCRTCSSRNGQATAISSTSSIPVASPLGYASSSTTAPLPAEERSALPRTRRQDGENRAKLVSAQTSRRCERRRSGLLNKPVTSPSGPVEAIWRGRASSGSPGGSLDTRLLSEQPVEGKLALRVLLGDNLFLEEGETRFGDACPVGGGIRAAEEHGHAEPLLDGFAPFAYERVRQQQTAGTEPARQSTEWRVELRPRDVKEDVQRDNGVERPGREGERAEVGVDERRLGQALACERDLRFGNVDAGEGPALRQDSRRVDCRAAAQLEHVWLGRE